MEQFISRRQARLIMDKQPLEALDEKIWRDKDKDEATQEEECSDETTSTSTSSTDTTTTTTSVHKNDNDERRHVHFDPNLQIHHIPRVASSERQHVWYSRQEEEAIMLRRRNDVDASSGDRSGHASVRRQRPPTVVVVHCESGAPHKKVLGVMAGFVLLVVVGTVVATTFTTPRQNGGRWSPP